MRVVCLQFGQEAWCFLWMRCPYSAGATGTCRQGLRGHQKLRCCHSDLKYFTLSPQKAGLMPALRLTHQAPAPLEATLPSPGFNDPYEGCSRRPVATRIKEYANYLEPLLLCNPQLTQKCQQVTSLLTYNRRA